MPQRTRLRPQNTRRLLRVSPLADVGDRRCGQVARGQGFGHGPTRRHRGRWHRRARRSPGAAGPRGRSRPCQRAHRRASPDLPGAGRSPSRSEPSPAQRFDWERIARDRGARWIPDVLRSRPSTRRHEGGRRDGALKVPLRRAAPLRPAHARSRCCPGRINLRRASRRPGDHGGEVSRCWPPRNGRDSIGCLCCVWRESAWTGGSLTSWRSMTAEHPRRATRIGTVDRADQ